MSVGNTPIEVSGKVIKHLTAVRSKSERQGVFLESEDETYLLRRRGGNPFSDPTLDNLVGKRIHCKGILTEHTLIISEWDVIVEGEG